MSQNFPHVTHHFTKDPDSGNFRVSQITPIVRLSCINGSLYIQNGRLWDEGGNEIHTPPSWFYDEVAKCAPQALLEAGLKEMPQRPSNAAPEAPTPALTADKWQCTDCGSVMDVKHKDHHIASHNRKRGADNQLKA